MLTANQPANFCFSTDANSLLLNYKVTATVGTPIRPFQNREATEYEKVSCKLLKFISIGADICYWNFLKVNCGHL